jgi:hypothetical protein
VQSPAAALCSYSSPAAKATVYGTWTPAGAGNPPADDDACRTALSNGTQISSADEGVSTYTCGCCGAINRRGEYAVLLGWLQEWCIVMLLACVLQCCAGYGTERKRAAVCQVC